MVAGGCPQSRDTLSPKGPNDKLPTRGPFFPRERPSCYVEAIDLEHLSPFDLATVRRSTRENFEKLYTEGGACITVLNANFPGLVVPSNVRHLCPLVLRYDVDPIVRIPDLVLTDLGLEATLSFNRSPFKTFVPWEAIDGMNDTGKTSPSKPAKRRLRLVP
jgi:hypothetical protein